jgi:Concanavalin A-like lectin/glucanases superfamily
MRSKLLAAIAAGIGLTLTLAASAGANVAIIDQFNEGETTFAASADFWNEADLGVSRNAHWLSESGNWYRVSNALHQSSVAGGSYPSTGQSRLWSRRIDLDYPTVRLDFRINERIGSDENAGAPKIVVHRKLMTDLTGSRINDGATEAYYIDLARGITRNTWYIQKKQSGDTTSLYAGGNYSPSFGGTYYVLTSGTFTPTLGTWYSAEVKVIPLTSTSLKIEVWRGLTGRSLSLVASVTDDGTVGGPALTDAGLTGPGPRRVGIRTDWYDVDIDNVEVETANGYDDLIEAEGPSSYWRLSENPATRPVDVAGGLSNSAEPSGARAASGLLSNDTNGAYGLDGTGWAVDPGDVYDFAGTAAFSFEAWVNPDRVDATLRRVANKQSSDGLNGWLVYYTSSAWRFERVGSGTYNTAQWSTPPVAGRKYHVVATYDGSTVRLYVNGTLRASRASSVSIVNHSSLLRIGRYVSGTIDEPTIYNYALSATDVAAHYAAGV